MYDNVYLFIIRYIHILLIICWHAYICNLSMRMDVWLIMTVQGHTLDSIYDSIHLSEGLAVYGSNLHNRGQEALHQVYAEHRDSDSVHVVVTTRYYICRCLHTCTLCIHMYTVYAYPLCMYMCIIYIYISIYTCYIVDDGWMAGWMAGWIDGCMDALIERKKDRKKER